MSLLCYNCSEIIIMPDLAHEQKHTSSWTSTDEDKLWFFGIDIGHLRIP